MVRSRDLTMMRTFGVKGDDASRYGLKLRTVFRILFDTEARVRIRLPREFNVAVISRGSLERRSAEVKYNYSSGRQTHRFLAAGRAAGPEDRKLPLLGWEEV